MKIRDLLEYGKSVIEEDLARNLLCALFNIKLMDLYTIYDKELDEEFVNDYKSKVERIKNNEPIQYVIGNVDFCDLNFIVNKNVLIPRFETEQLVMESIELINKYFKNPNILDLCTGSGCIGLTLKSKINSNVTLSDISKEALEVARENSNRLNLEVNTIESDLFNNINDKFDVIISNPPYIGYNEEIMDLVKNNEPHLALYADNNGLAIYERIFKECKGHLNEEFIIGLELNSLIYQEISELAKEYFDKSELILKKDYCDRYRMLFILNTRHN